MRFNSAFWRWFGNSQVVDKNGDPLVVYHGTFANFDAFMAPKYDIGIHFGTKCQAESRIEQVRYDMDYRASKKAHILKCYLSVENPLQIKDRGYFERSEIMDAICAHPALARKIPSCVQARTVGWYRKFLIENGYDGFVYKNTEECPRKPAYSWIALYPEQIKAIDNDGSWDKDDPGIRSNPRRRR